VKAMVLTKINIYINYIINSLVLFTNNNIMNSFISPLDQFEIRNLLSLNLPILGNLNISFNNIALYMTIAAFLSFTLTLLATNYNILVSNN
jgi:hypothetical protein